MTEQEIRAIAERLLAVLGSGSYTVMRKGEQTIAERAQEREVKRWFKPKKKRRKRAAQRESLFSADNGPGTPLWLDDVSPV